MKHEYEATYLNIDVDALRAAITAAGGTQVYPKRLFTRYVFESDTLKNNNAWLRVRDEGDAITITLKRSLDTGDIETTQELEIEVSDMHDTVEMLQLFGMEQKRHQENYREKWKLGSVTLDIDTWPQIPTYVEIEGPDKDSVLEVSEKLGFDYADAKFGSVDEVYSKEYGIDILSMSELTFDTESQ